MLPCCCAIGASSTATQFMFLVLLVMLVLKCQLLNCPGDIVWMNEAIMQSEQSP